MLGAVANPIRFRRDRKSVNAKGDLIMRIQNILAAAVLTAAIGGLIVPAFAQMQGPAPSPRSDGMDQMQDGARMGHGMMSQGGMSRGMMSGGCAGMMQSMNGGDGRPNSQWHTQPGDNAKPD
jgi:hypothetical protein